MFADIIRHAGLLIGPLKTQQVHLQGLIKGSQTPLRAEYSGSGASLPFLAAQLFENPDIVLSTPRAKPEGNSRSQIDLFLIERSPLRSALFAPPSDLRIPAWVSQCIHLNGAQQDLQTLFSRHLRREVERQTRRHDYSLDFHSDTDRIRRFFRDMYLPYVTSRFQGEAVAVSEEVFLERSTAQTLACLYSHGEWVAGMLLKRSSDTLRFGWFGARSAPPPPGASEVLDALVIRWAATQGLHTVVLGHSRPSLNDGVVRYKRRFGAAIRATPFPQPQIFIRIVRGSDALTRCLDAAALVRVRARETLVHRLESHGDRSVVRLEALRHDAA